MAHTSGPYAKTLCTSCFRRIEVQISARNTAKDIDDLRSDTEWKCAECTSTSMKSFTEELKELARGPVSDRPSSYK